MEDELSIKEPPSSAGSECATLVELLQWRAFNQPNQKAYAFLASKEEEKNLTYAELDRQARAIGAMLQGREAAGERVLLLYPAGLEYIAAFFGCLYAGALAVPAYPPHSNRSIGRIESIFADVQAKFVLTHSQVLSKIVRGSLHVPGLQWIATDRESREKDETLWQMPKLAGSTIAFLQYTSGSTATPKGVMVSHSNLLSNHRMIQSAAAHPAGAPFVCWPPIFHDMGLIGHVLQALYMASPCILLPPTAFVQSPFLWLQAISRSQAHSSGAPNFAYDLCVEKITPEQRDTLDLSHWKFAFCAAEPIRYQTLTKFATYFAPCGFRIEALRPCYGLAEATVFATDHRRGLPPVAHHLKKDALERNQVILFDQQERVEDQKDEKSIEYVNCGQAELDARVVIADPETDVLCPAGRIGEIWIAGSHVAQGYWKRPQETETTFHAYLKDTGEGPFLRTGDLGFLLDDGLFVTGRVKDLIIIQGRNHYPQDIEQTAQRSHGAVRPQCGAAFSVLIDGEERVVLVQEIQREYRQPEEREQICRAIRQAITEEHDIAVHAVVLIRYGSIPKTSSGKIQRSACRSRFLDGTLDVVYQWTRDIGRSAREERDGVSPSSTLRYADVPEDAKYRGGDERARTSPVPTRYAEITGWLVARVADLASVDPSEIDTLRPFSDYGLGSASAMSVAGDLERWLGCALSPTLLYDYPTISALAHYLQGPLGGDGQDGHPAERLLVPQPLRREIRATSAEPIAIIGLGCRFPGADSPDAFWQMLHDGIDGISEVPATRWDTTQFYSNAQPMPEKMNTHWGGFLQNIEWFDPSFFHISLREAEVMDPQQRLLLEVAWETFVQAGLVPTKLAGRECGVFVGVSSHDYYTLHYTAPDYHQAYTGTGNAQSITANRLSYFFDFHGPSMAIDTACSSSLLAVHQACQSLRLGECDLALAGGVNVILTPELTITFSQARMLSSTGRCKTFDEAADGYVRGEGCGLVLLKPLADALRDGDRVLAIIRGSAVNQDGRSNGLTAPHGPLQKSVIQRALQHAGVRPSQISYVETHGSGTPLGDPIEVGALKAVLLQERSPDQPCLLGAVKTNIGHLEAAAGIAGLIKTVLCLHKGMIVPNLNFNRLNPHIALADTPFAIPTEPMPWPDIPNTQRFAGVSAFGFGGTNVHVVLEGPPLAFEGEGRTITWLPYLFKRQYCWFKSRKNDEGARVAWANENVSNGKSVLQVLRETRKEEHRAILTTYVQARAAHILCMPVQELETEQPLTALGFDSIMAVELRRRMEHDLRIRLPFMSLLRGPSITQLVELVLQEAWAETSPVRVPTEGSNDLVGVDGTRPAPSAFPLDLFGFGVYTCPAGSQWEPMPFSDDPLGIETIVRLPDVQEMARAPQKERRFPLSHNQKALWFLWRLAPEATAYNVLYAARIQQPLDVVTLQRVLCMLAVRYPVLTATYPLQNGEPVQQMQPNLTLPLEEVDVSNMSLADLKVLLREGSNQPVDLTNGPILRIKLYRRTDNDYVLSLLIHHIAADLRTLELLLGELCLLYDREKTGRDARLDRSEAPSIRAEWTEWPDFQYADYVPWQQSMLHSEEGERHWQYWRNELAGDLPVLGLPTDRPRPPLQTYKGTSQSFSLDMDLVERLRTAARAENVTLFTLMLTAYHVLLHRYTHQDDILVATPALGRTRAEWERIIGYLANPVVVRAKFAHDLTFKGLLQQTKRGLLSALEHQDFPFPLLVERLQPHRDPSYSPIVQTHFIWDRPGKRSGEDLVCLEHGVPTQQIVAEEAVGTLLSLVPFSHGLQGAPFDLNVAIVEMGERLSAEFRYNIDLFDASTIARMAGHFLIVLAGICNNSDLPLGEIPLLSEDERQTLLMEWNAMKMNVPQDMCVHQLFERQVEQTPEAIAAVFEGSSLTYRELNSQANQLASRLRQVGIGPEQLVGICLERSLELVVAQLAVLKAGGAYVPLDPSSPPERFTWILEDAHVSVVITQTSLMPGLLASHPLFICLDANWPDELYGNCSSGESEINPVKGLTPENLAYVIYTSGSTGKPKGVMVTHANVSRLFLATASDFCFQADDVWTLLHSTAFDLSVWEIWGALLHGGRLVIVPYWVSRSPDQFSRLLNEQQVTVLTQTPSAFSQFMQVQDVQRGNPSLKLRLIIFAGEALDLKRLDPWVTVRGDQEPQLINMYGITETTVHVTSRRLLQGDVVCGTSSPIGRAIPDLQLYILDAKQQLVHIGGVGELFVGGAGLARGYVKRPELTAERFVPHPWSQEPGARLYRTGDLARYCNDGEIEYLGRLDQQVKIRGYRIEQGEIEAILLRHPMVREAVVVAREDTPDEKHLVAYVVVHMGEIPGAGVGLASTLRGYCREQLPDYMVPAFFVLLEALPLTSNGKVDRRALPMLERSAFEHPQGGIALTPTEEIVVAIYREVLRVEQIGSHESFFDLGGHSLLAIRVISRIRVVMGVELSVRSLFETPSVTGLAKQIERQMRAGKERTMPPLVPMSRKQDLPLSFAQQRLWFMDRLQPESTAYQGTEVLHFHGALNARALERSLEKLMHRHEILRTTFAVQAGEPIQVIHAADCYCLPVIDLCGLKQEQGELQARQLARQDARHPCNLEKGPLLRVHLLRLGMLEHQIFLTIHHIITDAWSNEILMRELTQLYDALVAGKPSLLVPLPLQYADYALWQRAWLQGKVLDVLLDYWTKQLAGARPLELPTDRPGAAVGAGIVTARNRGAVHLFTWSSHLWLGLTTLSQEAGVTLFMALLTAFQILLSRSTGEQDIVVGTDVANRTSLEMEGIVGFFVNLLVLRVQLCMQDTFRETLRKVATIVLTAYAHQDLPFEKLVDALQLERNSDQVPLVNILFVLQNMQRQAAQFSGLTVKPVEIEISHTKFDLALFLTEKGQEISGVVNYRADLFDHHTIATLIQHFTVLLQSIVTSPDIPIELLDIQSREEKAQQSRKEVMRQEAERRKLKVTKRHLVKLVDHDLEGIGG